MISQQQVPSGKTLVKRDILHLDGFKHTDHQKKTQSSSYTIAHVRNRVCKTPSRATDDVCTTTKTYSTKEDKQKFPASNISSSLEHAFHSTYNLRKTIEAALQNNNNNNTKTRHNNDKENLNNNEISSSHNQKFPLSTTKTLLRRSSTKKKKKKDGFLPEHPKRKQNSSYTRSRRITTGEGEGAQAADICYQKNPGKKKKG